MASRRAPSPGSIEAVILDWAGTTVDFGCMAPVVAFEQVFELENVPITIAEARAPMGAHKRVHIEQLCQLPSVRQRWLAKHGSEPTDEDVERMFRHFVPAQLECLDEYSRLVPGTIGLVAKLRTRGIRIGSTTGYTSEMMDVLLSHARAQGYEPDATVCADDVPRGRPYPYMCFENAIRLGVSDVRACVKVDDTLPGIAEGRAAGMWTIGLAVSGNEVGLPLEQWQALDLGKKRELRRRAYMRMDAEGADFVVDTIADVWPCIETIAAKLSNGLDEERHQAPIAEAG